jgi:iron complex transport system substrate-binding protein
MKYGIPGPSGSGILFGEVLARRRNAAVLVSVLALLCGCSDRGAERVPPSDPVPPRRIVSLAPSLTETLFALGVGDRVVGVTRYCAFPPEVRGLPKVGGHLDPNFEAIVSLEPDLVVLIPSGEANARRLESLGVPVLQVDQHDVESLLNSVSVLAAACGVEESGIRVRADIERRLAAVAALVEGAPRPRTVVVVGHDIGGGVVRSVWAAGPDTFYSGVLEVAGGVNAVQGGVVQYPEISREGLATLDPDVVLDVVAGVEERGLEMTEILTGWRQLNELRAVREDRFRVLEGDVMVVPGPRLPEMVREVAVSLHPELDWTSP